MFWTTQPHEMTNQSQLNSVSKIGYWKSWGALRFLNLNSGRTQIEEVGLLIFCTGKLNGNIWKYLFVFLSLN